ncbi:DNA-3-methyladenine glycosylase [Brevundimonas sp. S30B]|nr:DNA-3-methyladenine glycosylase [Brevundimonas sp. MF30-B]TFW02914.1 DNA-3-methyladenine glycosylase [Brevundimonas sp. S30B]
MVQADFHAPAETLARELIGAELLVGGVGGRIVETEAYDARDPASHSFRGPTARNAPMFGPPGRAYVYRIYGLHWCFNIVCDAARPGSAVLIRALAPTRGLEVMQDRRRMPRVGGLCSGPGKLCQALAIDGRLNGAPVTAAPFTLVRPARPVAAVQGPRVGITAGAETPWRFVEAGSPFLSRPLREAPT